MNIHTNRNMYRDNKTKQNIYQSYALRTYRDIIRNQHRNN